MSLILATFHSTTTGSTNRTFPPLQKVLLDNSDLEWGQVGGSCKSPGGKWESAKPSATVMERKGQTQELFRRQNLENLVGGDREAIFEDSQVSCWGDDPEERCLSKNYLVILRIQWWGPLVDTGSGWLEVQDGSSRSLPDRLWYSSSNYSPTLPTAWISFLSIRSGLRGMCLSFFLQGTLHLD